MNRAAIDYLGKAEDYPRIEDAETHFVALNEQLAAIKSPDLKSLWRLAGFAACSGGRLYCMSSKPEDSLTEGHLAAVVASGDDRV